MTKTMNGDILTIEGDVEYDLHYGSTNVHVTYEAKIKDGKLLDIEYTHHGDSDMSEMWAEIARDEIRPFLN